MSFSRDRPSRIMNHHQCLQGFVENCINPFESTGSRWLIGIRWLIDKFDRRIERTDLFESRLIIATCSKSIRLSEQTRGLSLCNYFISLKTMTRISSLYRRHLVSLSVSHWLILDLNEYVSWSGKVNFVWWRSTQIENWQSVWTCGRHRIQFRKNRSPFKIKTADWDQMHGVVHTFHFSTVVMLEL